MKTHNRSNALLMELLIVILVFMLATALLMQVFAKARKMEDQSRRIAAVTAEAQSQADRIYAAENPEAELRAMGFTAETSGWTYAGDGTTTVVTLSPENDGWTTQELTVRDGSGEILLTLPCSRWREVAP